MWSDPEATDVKVSIRIHSGSAFDPQGKEGVMKLLADNIFPTPESRSFFAEDLGGSVDVVTNYDYIQINATAKSSEFLTLLETLAQAVSTPTIDKETTTALKKSLADQILVLEKDPAYVADHAAAKRLFGTFPYGRHQTGTIESLQRIDFADLQFAQDRYFSADNVTVAISGNFSGDLGFRAARRYFGPWLKSDKKIPSTFRQPDEPDAKPLEIAMEGAGGRTSFALRGLSRSDPDHTAAMVLENILRARANKSAPGLSIRHHPRILPGVVTVSGEGSIGFPFALFSDRITQSEFAKAKNEVTAEAAKRTLHDQWLDVDTYRTTVAGDALALQNVAIADVQRVADRLAKNPVAAVVIRSSPTPAQ
jgi:predicted Zn-dependent peptidase